MACNGFAEVRLLVIPSAASNRGMTRFVLEDVSGTQTLLDTSVAHHQIRAEDWLSLRFNPDWSSAGKQYALKISGATDQELQFLYTPQSEFDLGASYESGQLLEEDLVLQYGCVTGLRKIWITGKP